MNVTSLPPKACAEYYAKALEGKATESIGSGIYIFRKPGDRNEVVILGPTNGHINRISHQEMLRLCPPQPK